MIETAILLCAGKGSRLRETTGIDLPKPLFPVQRRRTILEYNVLQLYYAGVRDIIIVIGYQAGQVAEHIQSIREGYPSIRIREVVNPNYEGFTGDTLRLVLEQCHIKDQLFYVQMGDHIILPVDLRLMLSQQEPTILGSYRITGTIKTGSFTKIPCLDVGYGHKLEFDTSGSPYIELYEMGSMVLDYKIYPYLLFSELRDAITQYKPGILGSDHMWFNINDNEDLESARSYLTMQRY
jgi:choline kinase